MFGFFRVEPQLRRVLRIAAGIDAVSGMELLSQVVKNPLVEVLAPQSHIAVGCNGAKRIALDFEDRDIERAAAQIVDQYT